MGSNRVSCHCQQTRTQLNHSRPQGFQLSVFEQQSPQRCQDECQWSLSRHCITLCNMIWSLQHHQALCPLVRPRHCRCTVFDLPPQSSGQSAVLVPASASRRASSLLSVQAPPLSQHNGCSRSCQCRASVGTSTVLFRILKLVLIAAVGNVDHIVCFFVVVTSRRWVSFCLSRPARWNVRSWSPLSRHRTVDLDCGRRCSIGLFLSSAHRRADSGLLSPAVGPLFSPAVGPLFSFLLTRCGSALFYPLWVRSFRHFGACWVCWDFFCLSRRARRSHWRTVRLCAACSLTCCAWFAGLTSLRARRCRAQVRSTSCNARGLECGYDHASLVLLWPLGRDPAKAPRAELSKCALALLQPLLHCPRASWSVGTSRLRHACTDRPVSGLVEPCACACRTKRSSRSAHGCPREPHRGSLSLAFVPSRSPGNLFVSGSEGSRSAPR